MLRAGRNNRNRRIARIKRQVEPFFVILTTNRTLLFGFSNQVCGFDGGFLPILVAKNLPTLRANADYCVVLVSQIVLVDLHDIPTSALFTQSVQQILDIHSLLTGGTFGLEIRPQAIVQIGEKPIENDSQTRQLDLRE